MKQTAWALLACGLSWSPDLAWARDPGPIDVRGHEAAVSRQALPSRGADKPATRQEPTYNPAELDIDDLHGPRAAPRERRRLYEEVEQAVDRGNGRIEDEQAYQIRRLQDKRDVRLGRVTPQREAERIEEENDRRRRIDQRRERQRRAERESPRAPEGSAAPERPPTSITETPGPGGSALARFVAEQEALLTRAREQYQRDLGQAEAERDVALAAADSRAERAAARRRFEERRSVLTVEYQRYRRGILGTRGAVRGSGDEER